MGVSDPEIQKKVLDRDGSTKSRNRAGPSGKGSFIACNAARFASLKPQIARINESSRLLA